MEPGDEASGQAGKDVRRGWGKEKEKVGAPDPGHRSAKSPLPLSESEDRVGSLISHSSGNHEALARASRELVFRRSMPL